MVGGGGGGVFCLIFLWVLRRGGDDIVFLYDDVQFLFVSFCFLCGNAYKLMVSSQSRVGELHEKSLETVESVGEGVLVTVRCVFTLSFLPVAVNGPSSEQISDVQVNIKNFCCVGRVQVFRESSECGRCV